MVIWLIFDTLIIIIIIIAVVVVAVVFIIAWNQWGVQHINFLPSQLWFSGGIHYSNTPSFLCDSLVLRGGRVLGYSVARWRAVMDGLTRIVHTRRTSSRPCFVRWFEWHRLHPCRRIHHKKPSPPPVPSSERLINQIMTARHLHSHVAKLGPAGT